MKHFNLKSGDYKISIPSAIEYEKYMSIIPVVNGWWWLRTPANYPARAAYVGKNGYLSTNDGNYVRGVFGVRPILIYGKYVIDVGRGDTFTALGNTWRVIDDGRAISEDVITHRRFDEKSNDWVKSELRAWLIEWAREREED